VQKPAHSAGSTPKDSCPFVVQKISHEKAQEAQRKNHFAKTIHARSW
jgi:hypothetical protein